MQASDTVLKRLLALHPKLIDLSLDRVYSLLKKLGNPHKKLPPVVHIAGTNGKGSTLAYIRSALEASGYSVHVYTSPHLIRFHERIRLAGQLITEEALSELLERVEAINGGEPITYFEVTTVAAFLAFSETPADIVLLETGLGGRLDATNVIDEPKLTIITPISMDHESFLGTTLEAIAGEKAGIIKTMTPVCVAPQQEPALKKILMVADQKFSRVRALGHNQPWGQLDRRFYLAPKEYPAPAMLGSHQVTNAATAMAALDMLEPDFTVSMEARQLALETTNWAGRLQNISHAAACPDGMELWVDGGHNPAAGQSLAEQIKTWDTPTHVIAGLLNTKSAENYLRPIVDSASSIQFISIPGEENSFSAEELAKAANKPDAARSDIYDALARIPAQNDARILICGSLYLVGWFMSEQEMFLS